MADDREQKWVKMVTRGEPIGPAAVMAGYSHESYGYKLRDRLEPELKAAMQAEIGSSAPAALGTLKGLLSAESEAVKRQAAKDLLSLGGYDIQRTEDVTHKDNRTDAELVAELAKLLQSEDMPEPLRNAVSEASARLSPDNVTPLKKAQA